MKLYFKKKFITVFHNFVSIIFPLKVIGSRDITDFEFCPSLWLDLALSNPGSVWEFEV